jgi:hypothetical protein
MKPKVVGVFVLLVVAPLHVFANPGLPIASKISVVNVIGQVSWTHAWVLRKVVETIVLHHQPPDLNQ